MSITVCLPPAVLSQLRVEVLTTALAGVFALFAPADGNAGQQAASIAARAPKPATPRRALPAPTNHWATTEVKEALVRMYPSENPFFDTEAIREAMRACGGPPLPAWSTIGVYAIQTLRLRRGKAPAKLPQAQKVRARGIQRRPTLRAGEPVVPFVAPTAAPGTALPPVDAPWDRIQSEALRQGS